jgi:hypothetical protein
MLRPGREADYTPIESQNEWSYTSTPPYVFMSRAVTTLLFKSYYFAILPSAFKKWEMTKIVISFDSLTLYGT